MPILLIFLFWQPILLANCSLLLGPYFAQNFASKFGQGLETVHSPVCSPVQIHSPGFTLILIGYPHNIRNIQIEDSSSKGSEKEVVWRTTTWDGKGGDTLMVRYPHEHHGNAGQKSNSCKQGLVTEEFFNFVDINSQPNGQCWLKWPNLVLFVQIYNSPNLHQPPLIGEFNWAQCEYGRGECSNGSCHNWLKKRWPKHGLYPHKVDCCDTCAKQNAEVRAKQKTLNRLQQANGWRMR